MPGKEEWEKQGDSITHHEHLESFNSKIFHQDLSFLIHNLISHTCSKYNTMIIPIRKPGKTIIPNFSQKLQKGNRNRTGSGMNKMNGISDAAKVSKSPMKGVLRIRAMIDGD